MCPGSRDDKELGVGRCWRALGDSIRKVEGRSFIAAVAAARLVAAVLAAVLVTGGCSMLGGHSSPAPAAGAAGAGGAGGHRAALRFPAARIARRAPGVGSSPNLAPRTRSRGSPTTSACSRASRSGCMSPPPRPVSGCRHSGWAGIREPGRGRYGSRAGRPVMFRPRPGYAREPGW